MEKRWVVLVACMLLAATGFSQSRPTIAIGHAGEVRALAGHRTLNYAFSAGEDGRLLVWDLESGAQYASYQLSRDPLGALAVHPTDSVVAVFVRGSLNAGTVIALDWVTGEQLFATPIDGRPTSLQFSPRGNLLVAALESFESLRVLDSQSGRLTNVLRDGFGVVSFVQITPNEQNLMTYVPSRGEFIYWSIATGEEALTVRTQPRLRHVTPIDPQTFRFLVGASDEELVVVDNLSGSVLSTYPIQRVSAIRFDAESGRIVALAEVNNRPSILAFEFRSGRLRRLSYAAQNLDTATRTIALVGTGRPLDIIAGSISGGVALHDGRNGRETQLGSSTLLPIVDAEFTDGTLYLSLDGRMIAISSDLFDSNGNRLAVESIETTVIDHDSVFEIARVGDALYSWSDRDPGIVWRIENEAFTSVYEDESATPISSVRESATGLLVLHRDGKIVVIDGESVEVEYEGQGLRDALWVAGRGLIAAKSQASAFDSSVIIVNELTGETVGASTDAFLTTRLALNPETEEIYTIGLFGEQPDIRTRLRRLDGRGLRQETPLFEDDGRSISGDLVWDGRAEGVLTTLGEAPVTRFTDSRRLPFESTDRFPERIAADGMVVVAVNSDGTATMWDATSGAHLADLYVFDEGWIAMADNGAFVASSRSVESNLSFRTAPGSRQRLADFRVAIPFRP